MITFLVETLTCKGMWKGPAEEQFQPFEELIQNDEFVSDYEDESTETTIPQEVNYLGIIKMSKIATF